METALSLEKIGHMRSWFGDDRQRQEKVVVSMVEGEAHLYSSDDDIPDAVIRNPQVNKRVSDLNQMETTFEELLRRVPHR